MEYKSGKRFSRSLHMTVLNRHFVLSKVNRRQDSNMVFRIEVKNIKKSDDKFHS